jgi:hypothetical protein
VAVASLLIPRTAASPQSLVSCQREQRKARQSSSGCWLSWRANKRRIPCYDPLAMAARTCSVTFTDPRGTRHTVDVAADTLYEAAALALSELKRCEWVDVVGPAARLEVEVRQAATRHEVTPAQVRRWCESGAVNPDERIRKDRVKGLLGGSRPDKLATTD